jgi:2-methylcitrate dehydratase PrpD
VSDPKDSAYSTALLDWLGCAAAGWDEPATRAARAAAGPVVALGTAGHVLDFDDTYLPGLVHLSAPTAPVALALAATVGEALDGYAAGFEAMAAVARASHPALYERGFHPTAVCGVVGAATTAAALIGADRESAVALALLRAGGLRAAFGSDGKALQVGMAAGAGVLAARLAAEGASAPLEQAARGFEAAYGASYAEADTGRPAIAENWIKAWPCCLQTHGAIEAADRARGDGLEPGGSIEVAVHPISLQAAAYGPHPADGLQAKFSIPYCVALTLLEGPPRVASFSRVDPAVAAAAEAVRVEADPGLLESEAILSADGREVRVEAALGSPQRPLDADALAAKLRGLAGDELVGALDDRDRPPAELLEAAGLRE